MLRQQILQVFTEVAAEQDRVLKTPVDDMQLADTGLDSLCMAHVVARLEQQTGLDPIDNTLPDTVGEFIQLYEIAAA
jgi:acyl carrier protein